MALRLPKRSRANNKRNQPNRLQTIYFQDHQSNKHRDRAVATVIPYTSTYRHTVLPSDPLKAPLSLQESGIFEEDDDVAEADEDDHQLVEDHVDGCPSLSPELSTQSTQTEAPAGELLQEVQRLQELRARIQERGSKPISPVGERHSPFDLAFDPSPLRERIRELEDRLGHLESERHLSKQREEELLDENYRLTENNYWLEAELKKRATATVDAEAMTCTEADEAQTINESEEQCEAETTLYRAAVVHLEDDDETEAKSSACHECSDLCTDCDERLHNLLQTEFCLRQQIAGLEQREGAFLETLRQADATWARLEADYEAKQREMDERLSAQVELNRALFEHLTKLNRPSEAVQVPMEVDRVLEPTQATQTEEAGPRLISRSSSFSSSSSSSGVVVSRTSTISRTSIKAGCDEIDVSLRVLLCLAVSGCLFLLNFVCFALTRTLVSDRTMAF